ncbi:MAG: DUF2779 domain-containing protein [Alphaproteobacteria bacterium]|nr:DUF2779 domain-containing protein [Alphaproteobacteria bacterium]MBU1513253.1 DUF2779 domain-containing protein [Alphaproteobacteria bacterium]MBU2095361.1 DUF2779 domain-containing protein [Alphaproteobacteria bacterium]MBU2152276.1 DUF2779 domain-containing protein [Alphaproteobacteria bacterium]MBU2306677.1 DUF2779 domain-containing protein [Alphaproteobacteria bacterium]
MTYLSKSQLAEFEQCEKRFWLARHRPELATVEDPTVFAAGHAVGAVARSNLPTGRLIEERDPQAAIAATSEALAAPDRAPIFEAAFLHAGVYVRTDILEPTADGWRLAEVKSSSSVKHYQVADVATQVWTARGAGLPLTEAVVRLVDNSFVYAGAGDYRGLLKDVVVDDKLTTLLTDRESVARAAGVTAAGEEPAKAVGDHCADPFACPFTGHCRAGLPPGPDFPVTLLPGRAGKAKAAELMAQGITDLRHAPRESLVAANELRIYDACKSGEAFHDREAMAAATAAWAYPRSFLDFETVGPAIPRWAGTRPFQAIPFQFSCHVQGADGALAHHCFLDLSGVDPRRGCAEALLAVLGDRGAIVTYNLPTERGVIIALAEQFADLRAGLLACAERLVDALPLVRAHYYHPQMMGSYSIKAVLPAVVPTLSYGDLDEVNDGLAAQRAYLEAIDPGVTEDRRRTLHERLTAYCRLDTLAMVELVGTLCAPQASTSSTHTS